MRAITIGGLALALVAAAPLPPGRTPLGQYGRWGAFRDERPRRCFAIAEPLGGERGAFATIASWPGAAVQSQVYLHLRRAVAGLPSAGNGAVTVPLVARGTEAWPADIHGDRRLVALIRAGGTLEVRGRDAAGRAFRDRYPADGAASAIDAARVACLPS